MSVDVTAALEQSRRRAAHWILRACAVLGVVITVIGLMLPVQSVVPGTIALAAWAIGYWSVQGDFARYRLVVGQTAVAQAIALVMAMSGTGWQSDAHMLFFVALSALVGLVDVRTIVMAAITIVLHHLCLGVFLPQLVFPSVDFIENIERALFHGGLVLLEVVVLVWVVRQRLTLTQQVEGALRSAQTQADRAAAASATAHSARTQAEAEAVRARHAKAKAETLVQVLHREKAAREEAEAARHAAQDEAATLQKRQMADQTAVVTALQGGLERIAHGDLSRPIAVAFPQGYEPLRSDYNRAIANMSHILGQVVANTGDLLERVASVNTAAVELADRTDKQVASLEGTSRSIERLRDTVLGSSESADHTAGAAGAVKADAVTGGTIVDGVIAAMTDIESSAQEIAKINAVMDAIAFQTNLLALNAGVEAARAGESGRGFSVVASEVRALSRRATEAAQGISALTERSTRQVTEGVTLVTDAGTALDGILASVADMTASVSRIAQAARDQTDGLNAVSASVCELDAVAQSNAVMFEETSTACQDLKTGIESIAANLRTFKLQSAQDKPLKSASQNSLAIAVRS